MSKSVPKELKLVKELINEFRYEEGLQLVKNIEHMENLTPEEKLESQVYKCWLYIYSEQLDSISYSEQLKIVENLYQKSQEMKFPLFTLDALCLKAYISISIGPREIIKNVEQYENLFKSIPRADTIAFQEKEAILFLLKGSRNWLLGKNNLALENHSKSLILFEQIDPHSHFIITVLWAMALDYQNKGELKFALECVEKTLSLIPEEENFDKRNMTKAVIYRIMGGIYYQKGDLNRALKYRKLSLEFWEKSKAFMFMGENHFSIFLIFLAQKKFDEARNHLQQFKQFNDIYESHNGALFYQLAHGLILKSSPRMRDHTKAENILKKIVAGEEFNVGVTSYALKSLCELYFEEFQLTHHMEILDDIYPLIDRLQKIASQIDSYSSLANVKLLQAKLALLQINLTDARKLLTEAQQIADDHGLQLLAGEISREHDHLLEELKLWESFKKEQASVAERLKLASIDGVMERLQGRRALEPLESSGQQPVSLLILAAGGVLLFSYPFSDEWKRDNDLFGSFLSAFSTFSDEFFSQGLDRAKFGEETILLQSVGSFSICYLFQGQTYFAKQKLEKFVETIQKNPAIWEILEKFEKSSQVAELKDLPNMAKLLTNVFLN